MNRVHVHYLGKQQFNVHLGWKCNKQIPYTHNEEQIQ
jgi:hypothetical protein